MKIFEPDLYVRDISGINIERLKEMGIKGVIVDIDNTLVPHNFPTPSDENKSFFDKLKNAGIRACLVSNNSRDRVLGFNGELNLPIVYRAKKPLKFSYKKAMRLMGVKRENTACIGDQLFIDVLGGRRMGLYTILVKPISEKGEGAFLRFKRAMEKKLMKDVDFNEFNKRKT